MQPAKRSATYRDLLELPDDVRAEIVAGEIVTLPSPLPRHSRVQRALSRQIGGPFDDDDDRGGPGGWWILLEVDIQLSVGDIVRPDMSGWHRQRLPDPWDTRPIEIAPDWVCEVLSTSNAAYDRVTKRSLYAQHGIRYYWLVDPHERTLEALRLEGSRWLEIGSYDDTALARIEPFEAIELEVGGLSPPRAAER